jgi:hypothetical protein
MKESITISRHKIRKNLNKIPPNVLKQVSDYIEFLLEKHARHERRILKFEGIWQGLGFEKLVDLESQIRDLRKETNDSLLKRVDRWNI